MSICWRVAYFHEVRVPKYFLFVFNFLFQMYENQNFQNGQMNENMHPFVTSSDNMPSLISKSYSIGSCVNKTESRVLTWFRICQGRFCKTVNVSFLFVKVSKSKPLSRFKIFVKNNQCLRIFWSD